MVIIEMSNHIKQWSFPSNLIKQWDTTKLSWYNLTCIELNSGLCSISKIELHKNNLK